MVPDELHDKTVANPNPGVLTDVAKLRDGQHWGPRDPSDPNRAGSPDPTSCRAGASRQESPAVLLFGWTARGRERARNDDSEDEPAHLPPPIPETAWSHRLSPLADGEGTARISSRSRRCRRLPHHRGLCSWPYRRPYRRR